jgi:hypothetical protein
MNSTKKLLLLAFNEINFDIVEKYIDADNSRYPNLAAILKGHRIRTNSETEYKSLEPWIQWPSIHMGKTYAGHGVFRLGDVISCKHPQIFEMLERAGYVIGSISAMNADNRLEKPAYFIPDPWTRTNSDGTFWSRWLSEAISQLVNDNANARISWKTALQMSVSLMRFARLKNYRTYLALIWACRTKKWLKAVLLDLFLNDVHVGLLNRRQPNFSTVFFNAGAHIQHHYLLNAQPVRALMSCKNPDWYIASEDDPVSDVLKVYDEIIGDYLRMENIDFILATGLSQKPYDRVKFYYRLRCHHAFLAQVGIRFKSVVPRMTRDFLVEFDSADDAHLAQQRLASVKVVCDGAALFGEIDNRGNSLFVTLTYPLEVTGRTQYSIDGIIRPLEPEVNFVAIKNGMHQGKGFAFFSPGAARYAPEDFSHVSSLGQMIMRYFGQVMPHEPNTRTAAQDA